MDGIQDMPVFPIIPGVEHLTPTIVLDKALPQRTLSTPQAVIHSTMPFVMWLLGERKMKARKATVCGHKASPGMLPETKILRFKVKYIQKSVLSWAGFLFCFFLKPNSIINKGNSVVFVASSFKKVGQWKVPMDSEWILGTGMFQAKNQPWH